MAAHPLFDEVVLDKLQCVADALLAALPTENSEVVITLRPGPTGHESDIDLQFDFAAPPEGWTRPEAAVVVGREFAAAWLASGHPMPAFRFSCRRGEDDRRQVGIEPLQEW